MYLLRSIVNAHPSVVHHPLRVGMVLVDLHTLTLQKVEVVKHLDYWVELFLFELFGGLHSFQLLVNMSLQIRIAQRKLERLLFQLFKHFAVVATIDVLQCRDVILQIVDEGTREMFTDVPEQHRMVYWVVLFVVDLFSLPQQSSTSRW